MKEFQMSRHSIYNVYYTYLCPPLNNNRVVKFKFVSKT